MRRQLSQQTQHSNSVKVSSIGLVQKNSVISSSPQKVYSSKESPQFTSNEISDKNEIDTGNVISGRFIGGNMDSRKLLKDVLNHNSGNSNENMHTKKVKSHRR